MNRRTALKLIAAGGIGALAFPRWVVAADQQAVDAEHGMIGDAEKGSAAHNSDPGAQWYPKAGFGLFLHWGLASVKAINISWPMIPGRALAKKKLETEELGRVIREEDWNLDGKPNSITPNQYWEQANSFNPQNYDPEKWCEAAKAAGFVYVVLTTKHHEGFAMWPSAFGDFNTKTHAGGKDLVKDYVAACRKFGLKVGLYFTGPDWHFDRDYMTFLYHGAYKLNPDLPQLDADLKPRTTTKSHDEIAQHQADFSKLFTGQLEELLTGYGEINVLWFDGKPAFPDPGGSFPISKIRKLQPQIVVDGRLHGSGDFFTYERTMPKKKTVPGWAELCNTWTNAWPYVANAAYRSNGWALGELATCRSMGINLLLGTGPMSTGELHPNAYKNMAVVAEWMKGNGIAVHDVEPLPGKESASVPAVAKGSMRYLYAIPKFENNGDADREMQEPGDEQLMLKGVTKPTGVTLLGDGQPLDHDFADGVVTVHLPASRRSKLVDVVAVELVG
jgi:alpha-L-fucosidase